MLLTLTRLRFESEVVKEGTLPRFFGPALRGALGLNFRRIVCVTHLSECEPCLLRFQCPYPRLFELFAPPDHPFAKRLSQMPRPFALQVPPPAQTAVNFSEGDPLLFRLTLWHHAESLLPYIVVAVQRTLEQGIGKGVQARLQRVFAEHPDGETKVFCADEGIVTTALPSVPIGQVMECLSSPLSHLTVRFVTPTRIDIGGKLQNPITFGALIKAANERGRALFWAYGRREPPWDGKALVQAAERVRQTEGEQVWWDLKRFSRRQQEELKVGGIIGWANFAGDDLTKFLPLLNFMTWVHVGKLATMGLGQIAITY